ncbi:MAG: 6-phosphofructokinase [Firmicutes bacterium]|jgi:6-phosphofructokinase|nr:6-phosphofructokinase [Bacillota bacterium]
MKNLLVAQSGGPTAAINATLCGVIEKAMINTAIEKIYGVRNGVLGILSEKLIELKPALFNTTSLQLLCQTPSSALGSCRMKLSDWKENSLEYEKIISVLKKYNIGYFVYIGGNDSMDTVEKLSSYCKAKNITDIKIIGAPKTIDNDLCETDHSPGFGSAAKYIATTFTEIACDCHVYAMPSVSIVEVMGRDTGWLTASSALARCNGHVSPDLIYVSEIPFDIEQFLEDLQCKLSERMAVVVAISEGLKNQEGYYIADAMQNQQTDDFGHKILAGTGRFLEEIVRHEIGCKVRSMELNVMQRCASHIASACDIYEARLLGNAAADRVINGFSGEMACIKRTSNKPYQIEVVFSPINKIANRVKFVPREWITEQGNDVTHELIDYVMPLVQGEMPVTYHNGIPVHFKL